MERTDVVVIGAGLIGSSIAWRLAQRGRQVILLDRGEPGAEASAAAAGLLIPQAGSVPPPLIGLYVDSLRRYGEFIAELREVTQHGFEYRVCGHAVLALDQSREGALRESLAAQRDAGLAAEWLSGDDARRLEPALNPATRGALYYPEHALLDNQRMFDVARAAVPSLADARFFSAWAGLRPRAVDNRPILGPDEADGLFWATGHLGMGILSAPTTAEVVADLVEGRSPTIPIESFSPQRFGIQNGPR